MHHRSKQLLNLDTFRYPAPPMNAGEIEVSCPYDRQYVLRMMINHPKHGWSIPEQFNWALPLINQAKAFQEREFGSSDDRFVYITVRHGEVTTRTDCVWHVDGFSMRKPHVPEQNYIWSSNDGMEVALWPITFPEDFDPMQHNIHQYFQDAIPLWYQPLTMPDNTMIAVDTYHIHRRPPQAAGKRRTMVRISFVPIQIESDTCEHNPDFPIEVFNRSDIRERLTRYDFNGMIT